MNESRARRLAAIVLNYGTPDATREAVEALQRSTATAQVVIVVDNTESRGGTPVLANLSVTYLATGRNLGFSGGMNVGIRHALNEGAERVLLVNSDARVDASCLSRLGEALDTVPAAGIAGPMLVSADSEPLVESLGIRYGYRTGRMRHRGFRRAVRCDGAARPVDAVSGCVMLVERAVFDAVGLLDEQYFFGFEDLDFCLRARDRGFLTLVVPRATAVHVGGLSMGTSVRRLYFAARNHQRVAARIRPAGPIATGLRAGAILTYNLLHAATAKGASPVARVKAVLRGTRDARAGRFGPSPPMDGAS